MPVPEELYRDFDVVVRGDEIVDIDTKHGHACSLRLDFLLEFLGEKIETCADESARNLLRQFIDTEILDPTNLRRNIAACIEAEDEDGASLQANEIVLGLDKRIRDLIACGIISADDLSKTTTPLATPLFNRLSTPIAIDRTAEDLLAAADVGCVFQVGHDDTWRKGVPEGVKMRDVRTLAGGSASAAAALA